MVMRGFGFAFGQNPSDTNQPLEDMGPQLATLDQRIHDLQASIARLLDGDSGEPPPELMRRVLWVRDQLETNSRRLASVRGALQSLTADGTRDVLLRDVDSISFRVNQLLSQAMDLQSRLTSTGAESSVTALENGTVAVTDALGKLERNLAAAQVITPEPPVTNPPADDEGVSPLWIVAGLAGAVLLGAILISDK